MRIGPNYSSGVAMQFLPPAPIGLNVKVGLLVGRDMPIAEPCSQQENYGRHLELNKSSRVTVAIR